MLLFFLRYNIDMFREPTYPYKTGKYGIPRHEFALGELQKYEIKGGSGRSVTVVRNNNSLGFYAHPSDGGFYMKAVIDANGRLSFSLLTRSLIGVHDDFFAQHFVDVAMKRIFRDRVKAVTEVWTQGGSDHYDRFELEKSMGVSSAEAANKTWSGQVLGKHGYQVRSDADVTTKVLRGEYRVAYARFTPVPISLQRNPLQVLRGLWR